MKKATILDYGIGNVASTRLLFQTVGYNVVPQRDSHKLENTDLLVLPGVGNFGYALSCLQKRGLIEEIRKLAESGVPIFGICLGMQILGLASEEAKNVGGLEIADFSSIRLTPRAVIGWRYLKDFAPGFYYHNHAFAPKQMNSVDFMVKDEDDFISLFIKNKIVGVQFHPEKSQDQGKILLQQIMSEVWKH